VRLAGAAAQEPPRARQARSALEMPRKQAIARTAVTLIEDAMVVYVDAGTTCQAIAALLADKRDLTVVTNDFYVVTSLLDRPEIQTIHTGGVVDVSSGSSSGRLATRTIGAINIDLCFLSTGAWSVSRGVTSPALDKVELKQEVMSRSSERVLVADSTKFGPGRASASWTWSCGSRPSRSERPAAWPPDPRTVDPRAADPTNAGTRSQGTEQ